jgi:8-oxo-dGTP pyrophosphatase MutT (NUDIX family)
MRRDEQLRAMVAERLARWALHAPDETGLRRAAVALVIADEGPGGGVHGLPDHAQWSGNAALVLTRRASQMRRHAGQWALPGGRLDEGETPEQAALRELSEEVGLLLPPEAVMGRLDTFITRSGFAMTPVVVWAGAAQDMVANPDEVASVHRIPITEFLRDDAPILEALEGSVHPVLKMPVGDNWIAAPTAALLYQFREVCLLGRATRVAHFEQPLFAWK